MSSGAHEPREAFVDELETRLRAELRRLSLASAARTWSWMPQTRWAAGLALSTMMVVSMALGGGVVAASYEARLSEQRDVLLASFHQRFAIAQQRLALAKRQLQEQEQRVSVGIAPPETLLDIRFTVNEAEAELRSIGLDLEEIQATGREPMHSLTAPLVSGRDFVAERWRVEMTAPIAALALEKTRAAAARGRVEVGIGKPSEVDAAATRIAELGAAIQTFERRLAIRQTYLKGGLPAQVAELQGLQAENEGRRTVLTRRIEAARRRVQDLEERIDVGTANPIELGEAKLRLQELQLEMSKADYDRLLIRQQLGK